LLFVSSHTQRYENFRQSQKEHNHPQRRWIFKLY
jgi:hypothetical protein